MLSPTFDKRRAAALLILVTDFQAWARRRIETITLIDDVSIRRAVSIDFEIPQPLGAFETVDANLLPWVPLTFFEKKVLRNFDLRDGGGRCVSVLTKAENGRLAGDTLVIAAETILGGEIPGSMDVRLREVAESSASGARKAFEGWRETADNHRDPQHALWAKLLAREGFTSYAQVLVENFVLLGGYPANA